MTNADPVSALSEFIAAKQKTLPLIARPWLGDLLPRLNAYIEHVDARLKLLEGMGAGLADRLAQIAAAAPAVDPTLLEIDRRRAAEAAGLPYGQ